MGRVFTNLLESRDRDPEQQRRLPTHQLRWSEGEALCWSEEQAEAGDASEGSSHASQACSSADRGARPGADARVERAGGSESAHGLKLA